MSGHQARQISNGFVLNNAGEWVENNYVKCSCGNVIWHRFGISKAMAEVLIDRHIAEEDGRAN